VAGVAVGPSGVPAYADSDCGGQQCVVEVSFDDGTGSTPPVSYSADQIEGLADLQGDRVGGATRAAPGQTAPPYTNYPWSTSLSMLLTDADAVPPGEQAQVWTEVIGPDGAAHFLPAGGLAASPYNGELPALYPGGGNGANDSVIYIRPLTSASDANFPDGYVPSAGGMLQIVFHTTGHPLDVTLSPTSVTTRTGTRVAFTASVAGEAPAGGYTYTWQFESTPSPGQSANSHTWTKPCYCAAQVWVTDAADGSSGYASVPVTVGSPSPAPTPTPTPARHTKRPHTSPKGPSRPTPPPATPRPTPTPTAAPTQAPTSGTATGPGSSSSAGRSTGPSGTAAPGPTTRPTEKSPTQRPPEAGGIQVTGTLLLAADHSQPQGSLTTADPRSPAAGADGSDHPLTIPGWLLLIAVAVVVLSLGMVREARTPRRSAGADRRRSEDG
jgi:hypothetical protein